jgi:hypothetical protein
MKIFGEGLRHQERKHQTGLRVDLDRRRLLLDFPPGFGLVGPRPRIATVKFGRSVEIDAVVGAVPLKCHVQLVHKRKCRGRTIRLALQMWCLTRPPPTITTPVFIAFMAIRFNCRRSEKRCGLFFSRKSDNVPEIMSKTRPGLRNECMNIMSPMLPSVRAGQKTGILFLAAQ